MIPITVIVTDNNRVDLLERTLDSFLNLNTYPILSMHVHNDGTDQFFKKIIKKFPMMNWHFSGKRIGYSASLDFLLSKVKTEYFFTCESDWNFYKNPGFMEKSLKILEENKHLHQVWLRDKEDHAHPLSKATRFVSGIEVRDVLPGYRKVWHGFSLNPGLRRMSDWKAWFPNGLSEFKDEAVISQHLSRSYKAVSLVESSIHHIGYGRRSINFKA